MYHKTLPRASNKWSYLQGYNLMPSTFQTFLKSWNKKIRKWNKIDAKINWSMNKQIVPLIMYFHITSYKLNFPQDTYTTEKARTMNYTCIKANYYYAHLFQIFVTTLTTALIINFYHWLKNYEYKQGLLKCLLFIKWTTAV